MRSEEEVLKRIDMELVVIYNTPNEVLTNDSWERAKAYAWVLEKNDKQDRWLRDRYEEVRQRILREQTIGSGG